MASSVHFLLIEIWCVILAIKHCVVYVFKGFFRDTIPCFCSILSIQHLLSKILLIYTFTTVYKVKHFGHETALITAFHG